MKCLSYIFDEWVVFVGWKDCQDVRHGRVFELQRGSDARFLQHDVELNSSMELQQVCSRGSSRRNEDSMAWKPALACFRSTVYDNYPANQRRIASQPRSLGGASVQALGVLHQVM